ncbi:uncharacterized protein BP5553_03623 [Venustampulla echinocandica]|uniref:Uncharacterized protein n=1 Tax=Venustampulla echinocandica TaxID=2656787 RepID=A0A370TUS0_9HELO|nr:uncharacterized protein BP5553_03623 [Venustampulla echinocandica]RDL39283.1 hypothetical protein BP5553_03623 [Venustampulla echinocandica]
MTQAPQVSQRPIYLVSYNNRLFPAHWGLWVPSYEAGEAGNMGKVIHVEGDARNGFVHGFKRNYDMATSERAKELVLLGWTDSVNVVGGDNYGPLVIDTIATDVIERLALDVPAPGPSLRAAGSSSSGGRRTRVDIQNCQTWVRQFVEKLIESEILEVDALSKLDSAPKN